MENSPVDYFSIVYHESLLAGAPDRSAALAQRLVLLACGGVAGEIK
jgi:hypothetical protein